MLLTCLPGEENFNHTSDQKSRKAQECTFATTWLRKHVYSVCVVGVGEETTQGTRASQRKLPRPPPQQLKDTSDLEH